MQKSKFIAMLLAVAMVVSMVVVPASASGEPYTIKLTANSATVAPGGTVTLTLSTAGTIPEPGVTSVGAVIKYPAGWTLTGVDDSAANAHFPDIKTGQDGHYGNDVDTYTMYWGMDALTTAVGDLATLTFTVPADAALQDYDFTVENGEHLDQEGTLEEGNLVALNDAEVAFTGCTVTVAAATSACPLHPEAEYTAVNAALAENWADDGNLGTGHYRLETDVTLNTNYLTIASGSEVCIDLNGHSITVADGLAKRVFSNSGTLNITDSVGTGKIYGGYLDGTTPPYGGNIYNDGIFRLYGGTISGGKVYSASVSKYARGGNIFGTAASQTYIYGGTIANGTAEQAARTNKNLPSAGGNIYSTGILEIKNATITGGTVQATFDGTLSKDFPTEAYGGSIYATKTLTIENSTIKDGKIIQVFKNSNSACTATTVKTCGGNIYAKGTVTVDNCTISGGSVNHTSSGYGTVSAYAQGGNIYYDTGTLNITNSTISNGTVTYNAAKLNTKGNNAYSTTTNAKSNVFAFGGNISAISGEVTLENTTISNGSVARSADATTAKVSMGGNVYLGESSTLNMSSGDILDGTVDYRGGNLATKGASGKVATVNLSGTTNINYGTAASGAFSAMYAADYSTINMSGEATLSRSRIDANTTMNVYGGYISQIYILSGVTFKMYGGRIGTLEGTAGATINNGYVAKISATGTIDSPACAHVNVIGTDGKRVWHNEGNCSSCEIPTEEGAAAIIHTYSAAGAATVCETCGVVHEAWHGAHTFDSEGNCTVTGCTKILVAHNDSCNCGGETVTWTPWDGNDITGGHYYLTDNMDSVNATITNACLDLNGYTLKVDGLFDASIGGNVIDTVGTGKLVDSAPLFNPSNSMLPIYVGDGYVFETPVFNQNLTHTNGDATGKFGFYLENHAADTQMDEALKEGRITIQVNVTWNGGQMTCALSSEMPALGSYADNWDTKMLLLTLTGLTDITGLTCTAQVYANGVTVQ